MNFLKIWMTNTRLRYQINELKIFEFEDKNVETVELNGDVLFNAKDVGKVLGMKERNVQKRVSEMEAGVCAVGIEFDRFLVIGNGLLGAFQHDQEIAQIKAGI